jgi:hypothetical protein
MKRPRPVYRQALHLAARCGTLRRSNDHLRMSLTAALQGEASALQQVRDLQYERDESLRLVVDLREEAAGWRSRAEVLWQISDVELRDGVIGALGVIEGLPQIDRPEVSGG